MLDIKFIRENVQLMKDTVKAKNIGLDLDELLKIDEELVSLQKNQQELQTQRNANSKLIPKASNEERPELIAKGKEISSKLKSLIQK